MESFYAGDKHKRHQVIAVALLFLSAMALGLILWYSWPEKSGENAGTLFERPLPYLSQESIEKIPFGFPRYYIFGVNPQVISGTRTVNTLNKGVSLQVSVWSESAPETLYAEYKDFFLGTGWKLSQDLVSPASATVTAERNGKTLILNANGEKRGTRFTLNYIGTEPR
jgi:hypothetical protein